MDLNNVLYLEVKVWLKFTALHIEPEGNSIKEWKFTFDIILFQFNPSYTKNDDCKIVCMIWLISCLVRIYQPVTQLHENILQLHTTVNFTKNGFSWDFDKACQIIAFFCNR